MSEAAFAQLDGAGQKAAIQQISGQTELTPGQVRTAFVHLGQQNNEARGHGLGSFGADRGRRSPNPGARGPGSAERGQLGARIAQRAAQPTSAAHRTAKNVRSGLKAWIITDGHATRMASKLARLSSVDLNAALYELGPSDSYKLLGQMPDRAQAKYAGVAKQIKSQFFGHMLAESNALGVAAKDQSAKFGGIIESVRTGQSEFPKEKAQQYVYLLVPGLVTEHQEGYFDNNLEFLKSQGLQASISKIDTDAGIKPNASLIRDEINKLADESGKQVIVIAHSKGVPDSAFAMKGHAVEDKVAAFLPMQGAYGGTPVADTVMGAAGAVVEFGLQQIFGAKDKNAVRDIGFETTNRLFNPRSGTLKLPTYGFVSCDKGRPRLGNILEFPSSQMKKKYDADSDGLVPVESQIVPGENSQFALLDGLHHADSVQILPLEAAQAKYRPEHVTQAQLTWALNDLN